MNPYKVKINQIGDTCARGGIDLISECKTTNQRCLLPQEVIWVPMDDSVLSTQMRAKVEKHLDEGTLVKTKSPATRPYFFSSSVEKVSSKPYKARYSQAARDFQADMAEQVASYDDAMVLEMSNRTVADKWLADRERARQDKAIEMQKLAERARADLAEPDVPPAPARRRRSVDG